MPDILSFLSGGIIGRFLGAFLGGFAKFFWEKWLPGWLTWRKEQKVQREKLLAQFRAPAIRAVSELQSRIYVILKGDDAGNYEYLKGLGQESYYINSTAFLTAQCFAWAEILRHKVSTLDYSELVTRLEQVTTSFSHGQRGFQVFRLEQREIGERMLVSSSTSGQHCMGYSDYITLMESGQASGCFQRLDASVRYLLEHPTEQVIRLIQIQHALVDLINFIDPDERWVPKDTRTKVDMPMKP